LQEFRNDYDGTFNLIFQFLKLKSDDLFKDEIVRRERHLVVLKFSSAGIMNYLDFGTRFFNPFIIRYYLFIFAKRK
jgi:hypothetical protein